MQQDEGEIDRWLILGSCLVHGLMDGKIPGEGERFGRDVRGHGLCIEDKESGKSNPYFQFRTTDLSYSTCLVTNPITTSPLCRLIH